MTPGTVSVETRTTWSQRLIASSTTASRCRGRSTTTRRSRAGRPRAPRAPRTPAATPAGRSARSAPTSWPDRGNASRSDRELSRPVVCSIESQRIPSAVLQAEHAVDAGADRVGVDQQRPPGTARPSAPIAAAKTVAPAPPEPPITPIVTPGAAPPSPTSVSSSTSQVSEAGSPPRSRRPRRARPGTASSADRRAPSTCTRWRRGGLAAASAAARSAPTSTTGALAHSRMAWRGVAHDLGHDAGGGAQAHGRRRRATGRPRRGAGQSHPCADACAGCRGSRRSVPDGLWTDDASESRLWARNGRAHGRIGHSAYTSGMSPVARPTAAFFDLDKTIIAKSSTLAFSQRVPGRRSDLARCGAAVGVRTVRLPRRRRRPRPDGEDAAVHVAAVRRLGRRDGQGDRRRHPAQHRRPARVRRGGEPDRGAPPRRPRRHHRLDLRVRGGRADRRAARRRQGDRDPDGRRGRQVHRRASSFYAYAENKAQAIRDLAAQARLRPRPRATPTATRSPTCTCSRRSATPTRSTPTRSCAGSRRDRGWPVLVFVKPVALRSRMKLPRRHARRSPRSRSAASRPSVPRSGWAPAGVAPWPEKSSLVLSPEPGVQRTYNSRDSHGGGTHAAIYPSYRVLVRPGSSGGQQLEEARLVAKSVCRAAGSRNGDAARDRRRRPGAASA